jgi:hypothetical protein
LVHLGGFIIKKSVMMHGHMNVKCGMSAWRKCPPISGGLLVYSG